MKMLQETGEFGSSIYRDKLFTLAPNIWAKMSNADSRSKDESERAQGDGIKINFDSPELLEEIYWRVFHGTEYIKVKILCTMPLVGVDDCERFRLYVSLILKRHEKKRYLSKNNNNILRIPSLKKNFPAATILISKRSLIDHAFSLKQQHRRFIENHKHDKYTSDYMAWLVHHEFGLKHKPFIF